MKTELSNTLAHIQRRTVGQDYKRPPGSLLVSRGETLVWVVRGTKALGSMGFGVDMKFSPAQVQGGGCSGCDPTAIKLVMEVLEEQERSSKC